MSQDQYFRAGAGTVIYNETGQILLFLRSGTATIWQLQQGGMDPGETIETTMWRELLEETAVHQSDIGRVDTYPNWLLYEYPDQIRLGVRDGSCLGQIHKWYFLKLKEGVEVDISKASDEEFTDAKWSTFEELLKDKNHFKHQVYEKLADYFDTHIKVKK